MVTAATFTLLLLGIWGLRHTSDLKSVFSVDRTKHIAGGTLHTSMSGSCGVCVDGVLYLFGGHHARGNTNRVRCSRAYQVYSLDSKSFVKWLDFMLGQFAACECFFFRKLVICAP